MYKKKYHLKSGMRKVSIAVLSGVMAVSLGLAAACTATDTDSDSNSGGSTSSTTDKQTILNGNFEFFGDSEDKTHIIYTPDSWTVSASGKQNYVMNGIIDTSKGGWEKMTADDLAQRLKDNDELNSDDEDYEDKYVDYNGMRPRDILYANPHTALMDDATDEQKQLINNPYTHDIIVEGEAGSEKYYYLNDEGVKTELTQDENGTFYKDKDKKEVFESHVLMLHNYVNSAIKKADGTDSEVVYDYNSYGTAQTYTSASTVTLEPNTAAEISLWVKTSDLMFDRDGAVPIEELGAYITVTQTVGGNDIDEFTIKAINTEGVTENNGWVQFTIFVQGCDFASSTVNVKLGLGLAEDSGDYAETVEGYAFFDDLTCTLYSSIEDSENYEAVKDELANTTCTLMSDAEDKVFSYDDYKNESNYYIDLASGSSKDITPINADTVAAQLTEDDDHYVTSDPSKQPAFYGITANKVEGGLTNHNLDIATTNDVIAAFSLSDVAASIKAASATIPGASKYSARITEALEGAATLPGADEKGNALMLLSSLGASYTATISGTELENGANSFTVKAGEYKIVSFWVKTSDMDGFTAATASIYDLDDEDTTSSVAVDTTDVTFDVGDNKDIYNGWVQCFFFVENSLDVDKTFGIDFSFGASAIKGTTASAYKAGYAVITNIQTFDITEKDIFSLAAAGTYSATFSFQKSDSTSSNVMDEVYGALSNDIKGNISRPSSYNGVNGASASVVYKEEVDAAGYDKRNANEYAGLVNRDYFANYLENAQQDAGKFAWLSALLENKEITAEVIADAQKLWNELFGTETVQPLLIVNAVREIGETAAMNYGFIASSNTTAAASGYQAITVRVKASRGAVAYVYLTDPDERTEISSFELPGYSFWYDSLGNVLESEPDYEDDNYDSRDHVVYTLEDNGLYTDKSGNYFANMYNYDRVYTDSTASYYAAGATEATSFNDLDNDTIYYISAAEAAKKDGIQSPHYLVATNSDGSTTKVFSYNNGAYRYLIAGTDKNGDPVINESEYTVSNFVIGSENGGADLRYDNTESGRQMFAAVDARYNKEGKLFGGYNPNELSADQLATLGYDAEGNYVAGTWQTVTFFVHTGDESKNYVVELWSGARDASGVTADGETFVADENLGSVPGSYVMFDYSNVTADEDSFTSLITEYTNNIIRSYVQLFTEKGLLTESVVSASDKNIAYYEELFDKFVAEGKLTQADKPVAYDAMYYTYSLFDDAGYIPFNADTAEEGETGYDYSADDYTETLVYLNYRDNSNNTLNVFVDYSATDVTVDKGTSSITDDDEEETTTSNTNVWLLVASIVLAVALIFTLISMFIRDLLSKRRRNRTHTERNVYAGKRKHFIRKLGLTEEAPATDDGAEAPADNAAENTAAPAEAPAEVPAEVPAEETPAENTAEVEADAEQTTAENAESNAEDASAPSEGDKPEENK